MTKIQPHPLRCIPRLSIRNAKRSLRSRGLQLIRQRVVVSPIRVVQETANRAQKIHGTGSQVFFRRRNIQRLLVLGNLPQPNRRLIVAQSTRRVFYVRFEMKNRVPIPIQPVFRKLVQLRQQERPRRSFRRGQDARIEPVEELRIPGQKPTIEQRQMKLDIVFFDPLALFERPPSGADPKSHVPQRAREIRNQRTKSLLGLLRPKQKQNIEVRIRK